MVGSHQGNFRLTSSMSPPNKRPVRTRPWWRSSRYSSKSGSPLISSGLSGFLRGSCDRRAALCTTVKTTVGSSTLANLRRNGGRRFDADGRVPLAGRQDGAGVEELVEAGQQVVAFRGFVGHGVEDFVRHERGHHPSHFAVILELFLKTPQKQCLPWNSDRT